MTDISPIRRSVPIFFTNSSYGATRSITDTFLTVLAVLNMNQPLIQDPISELYNKILKQDTDFSKQYITNLKKSILTTQPMAAPTPTSYVGNTVAYQYGTSIDLTDPEDIHGIVDVPKPEQDVLEEKMHSCVRVMTDLLYYASGARPRSTSEITQYKERLAENLLAMYNHTGELSHLMYTKLQEREDGQTIIESSV